MSRCSYCGHFLESHDVAGMCWTIGCPCKIAGTWRAPSPSRKPSTKTPDYSGLG